MPTTPRRLGRLPLVAPVVLVVLTLWAPATAAADTTFELDLYFRAGYERQVNDNTCIAASTAMMVNFGARRDLDLAQRKILRYAQARDALDDAVQRGSDPLGWSEAATYYSRYGTETWHGWRAFDSELEALRAAAEAIARTGKPVGLTVRHGRHAVVMTGFSATGNPARSRSWSLNAVYISDPYGDSHRRYAPATTSPLNRYLETDATSEYDSAWYGRYVVVLPLS